MKSLLGTLQIKIFKLFPHVALGYIKFSAGGAKN
jgi:hypothetical protein